MPKERSPVLGFNHNMKHRGLVFHVQTEDSGVKNPHIFTHCFHGGVILNSRKMDYDASSDEETVKALMQSLHKAMLKQLKKGEFDEKIDAYLGSHPDLKPVGKASTKPKKLAAIRTPPPTSEAPSVSFTPAKLPNAKIEQPNSVNHSAAQGKSSKLARKQRSTGAYSKVRRASATRAPTGDIEIKPAPTRKKRVTAARGTAPGQHASKKGNVVISRPSVVLKPKSKSSPAKGKKQESTPSGRKTMGFGSDMMKGQKLDDVIKAYLSEQKKDK